MKRLVTAIAGVGLMLAQALAAVSPQPATTPATCFPSTARTSWRPTPGRICHGATGSCDFTVGADMKTPDGVTGFPHEPVVAAKHRGALHRPAGLHGVHATA